MTDCWPCIASTRLSICCGTPTKRPAYWGYATRPAADYICKYVTQPPALFRESPLTQNATRCRQRSSFIFHACRNPKCCVLDILPYLHCTHGTGYVSFPIGMVGYTTLGSRTAFQHKVPERDPEDLSNRDQFLIALSDQTPIQSFRCLHWLEQISKMLLQKSPPQGAQAPGPHSTKRRQMQERRRTLQTISELSVTDGNSHDFGSLMKSGQIGHVIHARGLPVERKTSNLSKRHSIPQYQLSPQCPNTQLSTLGQVMHKSVSRQSVPRQVIQTTDRSHSQEGWNAIREKARVQREQAVVGARVRRQASGNTLTVGGQPSLTNTAPLLPNESSRDRNISYTSHQQLLRNSRSIRGLPQTLEWRPSVGGSIGTPSHHEHDTESSGRASTDSSSYHSSHDSAVRRSRSGSSNRSFTLEAAPPLPNMFGPSTQRHYLNPASLHGGSARTQFPASPTARPTSTTRSSSLPSICVENVGALHPRTKQNLPGSSQTLTQKEQHVNIQAARLATLAALTASHHNAAQETRLSHASALNTQSPHRSNPTSPQPRRYSSSQAGTRSNSTLHAPPPAYLVQTSRTTQLLWDQNPDKYNLAPERVSFEQRPVPRRESLAQWNAEREEARAGAAAVPIRPDIKERVRRANQLEEEREKELLLMGKGAGVEGKENNKKRGCWGGLFAILGSQPT